ncbi:MAG: hypothetical protein COW01_05290 [Bdellovibrionales bacterium CG12_big_fil_rev_8_21_14_0_65_38_15]|nr:MAG: hypothetical protein COW79_00780 [Bdellovibrionales bacterium CG22_combo_CG10-13_8_21_14_all_38_13]PIQ56165.1 MAG: hypothetical protein COW01_05290 [Bdellovibrionales bacterium CG12_big_fil_rev_8_21_14_0_65_38_15]PIR28819.1 MAG: hypothetical protein COV38_14030 [Bdellovibrionales bacterium CG11_big_fil_rev_8_21_14_0_20_38_13]
MKKLLTLLSLCFSLNAYSWGWEDFKTEFTSPYNEANTVLLIGTGVTLTSLIFEDQIVDPLQSEVVDHKPLGSFSKIGDYAGQLVPNTVYALSQTILGYNGDNKGYQRAIGMLKATSYAALVTTTLKYTIREKRPNSSDRNSFPSGHTTTAFAFSGYVWQEHGWKWGIPAMGVGLLTGFSRINDNKHYLHDVLAGATIGLAYGLGISKLQAKESTVAFLPIVDQVNRGLVFTMSY